LPSTKSSPKARPVRSAVEPLFVNSLMLRFDSKSAFAWLNGGVEVAAACRS
jgi:hypothetical protein